MKKFNIILLVFTCLCSTFSFGEENWRSKLFKDNFDLLNKNERHEIANGFLADLKKLDAYIPALKETEKEWLKNENLAMKQLEGELYMNKVQSYLSSREYNQDWIKTSLKLIETALQNIVTSPNKKKELLLWTLVVYQMTDELYNDSINTLHKSGFVNFSTRIKNSLNLSDYDEDPWFLYRNIARQIQKNIIIPMIQEIF